MGSRVFTSSSISSVAASGFSRWKKKQSLFFWVRSGYSPPMILWALVMMLLFCAWRKISFSATTGTLPLSIRSRSRLPAPTDGNWSQSPTSTTLQLSRSARSRCSNKSTSTIDISSTTITSHSRGLRSSCWNPHAAGCVVFHFQHPVNGACLIAGEVRDAACGTSGGCGDHDTIALLFIQGNDAVQRRGLSRYPDRR